MIQALIKRMVNGRYDEIYTPSSAIEIILHYLNKTKTYWECTDYGNSNITKVLKDNGFNVISTHLNTNFDFLKDKPDFEYDVIITNPPYSIKDKFIARAIELGKPFIYLLPLTALGGKNRHELYNQLNSFGICVLSRRINFLEQKTNNYFNTSWFFFNTDLKGIKFIKYENKKRSKF